MVVGQPKVEQTACLFNVVSEKGMLFRMQLVDRGVSDNVVLLPEAVWADEPRANGLFAL